ncbi:hypothetical protein PYCC9005_002704 [Savitreella phatthalungensis]
MVMLSAQMILLLYSSLTSALALFCIISPSKIVSQGSLQLMRDAMQLHDWPFDDTALVPVGLVLLVLSLHHFALYVRNDVQLARALAPWRFLLDTAVCVYAYAGTTAPEVANGVVFGLAFGDMIVQYWIFSTVREESKITVVDT